MFLFAAPFWLFAPAAAALAGGWFLWRGHGRRRSVPSTKLWRDLAPAAAPARRRIDPLWLLVLLAACLAAFALAGPMWAGWQPASPIPVEWNVRSVNLGGTTHAEAWVRLPGAPAGNYTLAVDGTRHNVTAETLRTGTAFSLPDSAGSATLQLQRADSSLATETFTQSAVAPLGLVEMVGQAPIDPALRRAFVVQGAAPDPTIQPTVVLLNAGALTADDRATIDAAAVVIAQPAATLDGITLGKTLQAPPAGWTPAPADSAFGWPSFAPLNDVRVTALREVTLSADWQTLATAGGHPWIALRQSRASDGALHAWLWLASDPATQTTWPTNPGFVAFFADLASRTLRQTPGRILDWLPQHNDAAATGSGPQLVALAPALGVAAIVLLLVAVGWFIGRSTIG